ncbi:MAG: MmgE/PrpD family protein [Candidatus Lustribacter sp.]|jgi:2-methylcitrate dehydratase PrpD
MGANEFVRELTAYITALDVARVPAATLDNARLHAFDSAAAIHAGGLTSEGKLTTGVLCKLMPNGGPAAEAARLCVSGRLTECDDIDLWSCTTPGAVVLPVALTATTLGKVSAETFMAGIIAGYQMMACLGGAANGPSIVYGARWPTYLGGAMTAAATLGKIIGLSEQRLLHALAIAASMTTGNAGRIATEPTSRWITLGCAVQAGMTAAIGAADGLQGDEGIFATCFDLEPERMGDWANMSPALDRVGLKPYHSSRQALATTEAFASLLREESIDGQAIEAIQVFPQAQYSAMIDRVKQPRSKGETRSIRYQLALAAFYPDELYDIERSVIHTAEPRVARLMNSVTVTNSEPLTALYPRVWAGTAQVKTNGKTFERELLHPRGDVENPLTWNDIEKKWTTAFRFVPATLTIDALEELARKDDAAGLRSALLG